MLSSFGFCLLLQGGERSKARAKAFAPLRGASYFSLLVQRKGSQKKARPASAPNALRASGPLRRRDFSTRHPCRVEKRRASMHVAPCGVLSVGSVAAEGNPVSQKPKSNSSSNGKSTDNGSSLRVGSQAALRELDREGAFLLRQKSIHRKSAL